MAASRGRSLFATLVACLACTGADPRAARSRAPRGWAPVSHDDPAQRAEIERDLSVVVIYDGPRNVDAGKSWPIEATLVNRGSGARRVIWPGDGSDMLVEGAPTAPGVCGVRDRHGWRSTSCRRKASAPTGPRVT